MDQFEFNRRFLLKGFAGLAGAAMAGHVPGLSPAEAT